MMNLNPIPTFLYGPFQKGEQNHIVLECLGAIYLGEAYLEEYQLWNTSLPIGNKYLPALKVGDGIVKGELYLLPNTKIFECYHGVPDLHLKERVKVLYEGRNILAEVYMYQKEDLVSVNETGSYQSDTE